MTAAPVQAVTRYEFLAALHELLQPRGYLEIGVQTGASLRLAQCPALGIDPHPVLRYPLPATTKVVDAKSDEFFESGSKALVPQPLDLVFIDGMHLWEYALRDFRNVERFVNDRTVVVFDDVLPRNQEEASRVPLPGDWTGDVWKVHPMLAMSRPDLSLTLVDTQPTGLLVVRGLDPGEVGWLPLTPTVVTEDEVPADVLQRAYAIAPELALTAVAS